MDQSDKNIPKNTRSLMSFGVSGLLGEDCKVYYENFFGSHHLGRTSDLICARLNDLGLDELRLRAILLFSLFEAEQVSTRVKNKILHREPLTIECGVDQESVAIGILFRHDDQSLCDDVEGLKSRILGGKPSGEFEKLLSQIYTQSDQVVIRVKPGIQLEVISLLSRHPKDRESSSSSGLEIVIFQDESKIQSTPQADAYVELGDLNHRALLRARHENKAAVDKIVIKKNEQNEPEQIKWVLSADASEGNQSQGSQKVGKFLKRMWPFKKGSHESETTPEREEELERSVEDLEVQSDSNQEENSEESLTQLAAQVGSGKFDHLFEKLKKGIEQQKTEGRGESGKSKRWIEELLGELMAEKGHLVATVQTFHDSYRYAQLRFRQTESTLREAIRHKDEELKQKTIALERAKEQLQKATIGLRKYKDARTESLEETQYRQKYELNQKILTTVREENVKLEKKVEDLRNQLLSSHSGVKGKGAFSGPDFGSLKSKIEVNNRQLKELKETNEQLSEMNKRLSAKLQEIASVGNDQGVTQEDGSHQIEVAKKQLLANQTEIEKMRLVIEDSKRSEERLRSELQLTQVELKSLKARAGLRSSGSSAKKIS